MKKFLRHFFTILFVLAVISYERANASHLYGGDLFYTHVSGNTYTITLVLYGDCGGSSFPSLPGSSASVVVYNGSTQITTLTLPVQNPTNGVEVTPVCSAQLSNTNCVSSTGTIPGVKKFTFTANYTLSGTSTNWRFRFNGVMSSASAGRSNSITNISTGTIMTIEATLNNTIGTNSSPVYTTIPTPFYCINVAANNNPGTVDANGDSLSYNLVTGLDGPSGVVSYNTGYSATTPIATSSGITFSNTTGQLSFTPNITQRSLVVLRVDEYRNGALIGTSMREMTVVVLSSCSNNPPKGVISSASVGTVGTSGTNITLCRSAGSLTFNINPTDTEGNGINVVVTGLPAGASFTITNNNTTAPTGAFSWNLATAAPGTYNFFITYTDDGCPLSSKQTIAYTIVLLPDPILTYALVSAATCQKKAVFTMTPSVSPSPWNITIYQGSTTIHSFGSVTSTKTDSLDPGTYIFRVQNANNCYHDTTITIAAPPVTTIPSISMVRPTCVGGSNGSITVTASNGAPPYVYAIGSGSYSSSNIFNSLSAATYTLHIKDSNQCVKDTSVQLLDPNPITLSIVSNKPRCNYYSSGLITVTASNGTAPYQYALGSGSFSSTNSYSGLSSGTYVIHVKDTNNCTKDSTFLLNDSISIHASAVVTHVLCNGNNTGEITLTGNSGTSPYFYRETPGAYNTTGSFTTLAAGSHNFRIKDVDSCYLDTMIAITQPTRLGSNSVVTNVLCNGQSNGSINITGFGGTLPYRYAIGSGSYSSSGAFNNLSAGTYTLHVKDTNDCVRDTTITITQPNVLNISGISITEPICNGNSNGIITFTGTGGTTSYTYAINTGLFGSTNTFSGLAAGTHTLHLTDANGCTKDSTITMNQPTPIIPTLQVKQSTCTPVNDGRVIVTATGGVPAYQYSVGSTPYGSSNTFTPLAAGTYVFHIKDTRQCVKDTTMTIIDSVVLRANYTISNVKCNGDSTGFITVNPTNGQSPYTYAKNTGLYGSSNTFNNLNIGSYLIKTKDVNGCTKDTTIAITEPQKLSVSGSYTEPSCYNYTNGIISIFGLGGTTPYNYAIGSGSYGLSGFFNALAAGTYTLHVKDANGCIKDTTITVTQPALLGFDSLNVRNVLCFSDTTGRIIVYGKGGTLPYTYAKDNDPFGTNSTLYGFNVGYHYVRIKDKNGCFKDTSVKFTEPTKLFINVPSVTNPTCEGYADGMINANATGGTKAYEFNLNGGAYAAASTFSNLLEGVYKVSIRDANGCTDDTTVTLTGYPHISIDEVLPKAVSCFGVSDGRVDITASGGVQPFTYQLNGGTKVSVAYFFDLASGKYLIRVNDDKNCFKDTSFTIKTPEKLVVSTKATPNDCDGLDEGGSIKAEVTGGTSPYSYKWSSPITTNNEQAFNLPNGSFKVIVSDANDCKDSASATVVYDNCCKVFVPNAFTPNGDSRNDKFRILFKGDFVLKTFIVYNRFGQKVFEGANTGDGWDGIYKGIPQDVGTYNYYVKGICGNNGTQEVEYKGTVTLVR